MLLCFILHYTTGHIQPDSWRRKTASWTTLTLCPIISAHRFPLSPEGDSLHHIVEAGHGEHKELCGRKGEGQHKVKRIQLVWYQKPARVAHPQLNSYSLSPSSQSVGHRSKQQPHLVAQLLEHPKLLETEACSTLWESCMRPKKAQRTCQMIKENELNIFVLFFKKKPLAVQETSGFSQCHRNKYRWRSPLQCSLPLLHHAHLQTEGSGYWDQSPRRSQTWEWVLLQMGWADSMPTCLVMDKSK